MAHGDIIQDGQEMFLEVNGKLEPVPMEWQGDVKGFFQHLTSESPLRQLGYKHGLSSQPPPMGVGPGGIHLETPDIPFVTQEAGKELGQMWKKGPLPPWLGYAGIKTLAGLGAPLSWIGAGKEVETLSEAADVGYKEATGKPPGLGLRAAGGAIPLAAQIYAAIALPQVAGGALTGSGMAGRAGQVLEQFPKLATALGIGSAVGAQSLASGQVWTPYHAYRSGEEIANRLGVPPWLGGTALGLADLAGTYAIGKSALPSNITARAARKAAMPSRMERLKEMGRYVKSGERPSFGEAPVQGVGEDVTKTVDQLTGVSGEAAEVPAGRPFYEQGTKVSPKAPVGEKPSLDIPSFLLKAFRPMVPPRMSMLKRQGKEYAPRTFEERLDMPTAAQYPWAVGQMTPQGAPTSKAFTPWQLFPTAPPEGLTPLYRRPVPRKLPWAEDELEEWMKRNNVKGPW